MSKPVNHIKSNGNQELKSLHTVSTHIRLLLFLFSILIFSVLPSSAQKFAVGARAGASASMSAFGDPDDKSEFTNLWKPGFFISGLVNFPLKNNFSMQTEFGYAQRGRKIEFNEDSWVNEATYRYLDGSMLLRKSYSLNWAKNVRGSWYFQIGPRISYWLGGNGEVTSGGFYFDEDGNRQISRGGSYTYKVKFEEAPIEPSSPDFDIMYMSDVNRWLFGLDFGIGVDAPTTALQRFGFEVRFTSGHTFYGSRNGAINRTLGFTDNLRANEKIISVSLDYTLNKDVRDSKKGQSVKSKKLMKSNLKPRKKIDSMIK